MRRLLVADYKQAALAIISIIPISIFTIWSDADWSRWKILMPLASPRPFLDLELLTYNSYCYASQTVFNISSDACGRLFNYPILLLQASSYFGVNAYWTFPLGVLMQFACLGVFFLLSYQINVAKFLTICSFSITRAIQDFLILVQGNVHSKNKFLGAM